MKTFITKEKVEEFLRTNPGSTQKEIAQSMPTGDAVYGAHKFVASAVVALRAEGKLPDVERCDHCSQALTRGRRNARLFLLEVA